VPCQTLGIGTGYLAISKLFESSWEMGVGVKTRMRMATERLLRQAAPINRWFAERDRLIAEVTQWRAERHRSLTGSKSEQDAILDLLCCLTPSRAVGFDKIRLGRDHDGGYVMLDDFKDVRAALSFGIDAECSWDADIAARGIDVYQFDHTVDGPPTTSDRFRFFKKQIAATASELADNIGSALAKIPPSDSSRTILKIDIEGSEWEVLDYASVDDLAQFSQILGEFHDFSNAFDPAWRETALRVMTKLRTIFEVVHVHGNNYSPVHVIANVPIPEALELTFANRGMYTFEASTEIFPTALDQPNCEIHPDIFLGNLRFR
jgi:Methyltransferase FkbM domain